MKHFLVFVIVLGLALPVLAPAASAVDESGQEREPYLESWKVAVRSIVLPGWGQFRLGESGRGQAYLAAAAVGAVLGTELVRFSDRENGRSSVRGIGWGIYGVSMLLSASDAWQSSERRNRENGWELGAGPAPAGGVGLSIARRF